MKRINALNSNKANSPKCILQIFFFFMFLLISNSFSQKLVVGYYPDYKKGVATAEKLQLEYLTHIIHSFAWPDANGNLVYSTTFLYPELIQIVHNAGKKVILGLGGWGHYEGFKISFADSVKRTFFADNVIQFCETNGYDGIDIDWEYPTTLSDKANLNKFVLDIKKKKPSLSISLAVAGTANSTKYIDFTYLEPYVDWIGLMAYDMAGSWSSTSGHQAPLYSKGTQASVDTYLKYINQTRGVPFEKIVLGIPFYGYQFKTSGLGAPISGTTSVTFVESMLKLIEDWEYNWDDFSKVPYLLSPAKDQLITFDDEESIRLKCDFANSKNLAGVMIWEITQDYFKGEQLLLENVGIKILKSMGNLTANVKIANIKNGFKLAENDTISIIVNASDSTGTILKVELYLDSNKVGEMFSAPYNFSLQGLQKGVYTIKALAYNSAGAATPSDRIFISVTNDITTEQTPYNNMPFVIPGKVEAEEFDKGGEGVAYHDTTPGNAAAGYSDYRLNEDVDCEPMDEGGYNVGYTIDNEWLEYSVIVDSTAVYDISFYVASGLSGGEFHLELDNIDVTGTIATPGTGGWGKYVTINKTDIMLEAGEYILRLFVEKGDFNIDNMIFNYKINTNVHEDDLINFSFKLNNNYPNPFNPNTNISFSLPNTGEVNLIIYDVTGREVKSLIKNEQRSAGNYNVSVDMKGLASGTYLYKLSYGNKNITKKMLYIK